MTTPTARDRARAWLAAADGTTDVCDEVMHSLLVESDKLANDVARLQLQGHSLFGKGQDALATDLSTLRAESARLTADRTALQRRLEAAEAVCEAFMAVPGCDCTRCAALAAWRATRGE